jgi:hypothetical protein
LAAAVALSNGTRDAAGDYGNFVAAAAVAAVIFFLTAAAATKISEPPRRQKEKTQCLILKVLRAAYHTTRAKGGHFGRHFGPYFAM